MKNAILNFLIYTTNRHHLNFIVFRTRKKNEINLLFRKSWKRYFRLKNVLYLVVQNQLHGIIFLIANLNHIKTITNFANKENTNVKNFCFCFFLVFASEIISFDRHYTYYFAVALHGNGHNKEEFLELVIDVRIDFLGILNLKSIQLVSFKDANFSLGVE